MGNSVASALLLAFSKILYMVCLQRDFFVVKIVKDLEGRRMRIIAGAARGLTLKVPRGRAVRPTADRVKEALFSILGNRVPGAQVLDLFAGSGALGLEALSRGANFCYFVEIDRAACRCIAENLSRSALAGRAAVINRPARQALVQLKEQGLQADLVFLDPPYGRPDLAAASLESLAGLALMKEGGIAVLEQAARGSSPVAVAGYWPLVEKRYGDTLIALLQAEKQAREEPEI